jgi:hypothetical protein
VIAPIDQTALQFAFFVPAELGEATVERLAVIAAVAFGLGGRAARLQLRQFVRHIGGADQVAATHLGAVDAEIVRRQLDQALAEK